MVNQIIESYMSILRRKWNFKCGMLVVACLGFSYQGCSSRYEREKKLQDELFYTNNPYEFEGYCDREFKALLTFKTTGELDRFVENLSVRLQAWEKSDHYKALPQRTDGYRPIDIWNRYRKDYLLPLARGLGADSTVGKLIRKYHDAMEKIFNDPHNGQYRQALRECHKSLSSKDAQDEISSFYLQNYAGKKIGQEILRRSLLDFHLLVDFVYGGNSALRWYGAINQVEKSLEGYRKGSGKDSDVCIQLWKNICGISRGQALDRDPVWRYSKNRTSVDDLLKLLDGLISGKKEVFTLTFDEIQSVIPHGLELLDSHLDHLDQCDKNVVQLRKRCDLIRPIVIV